MNATLTPGEEYLTRAHRHSPAVLLVYEKVFGEKPNVEIKCNEIHVNGWVRLVPQFDGCWVVQWDAHWEPKVRVLSCMKAMSGTKVVKPSFEDALVCLMQQEAHVRTHWAADEVRQMMAVAGEVLGRPEEEA